MFHVKHSSPPPFINKKDFDLILKGGGLNIKNLPPSLLPIVLDSLPFQFCLVCPFDQEDKIAADLSMYLEGSGVFCGARVYEEGVRGSYAQEQRDVFYSSLGVGFKNKKFILTSFQSFGLKKISKQSVSREIKIDKKTSYSSLIDSLLFLKYNKVDFVDTPGSFAVRGGVVDFFPKESLFGVRVLFEKEASLFYFDIKTQITTREISFFVLAKTKKTDLFSSLKEELPPSFKMVYINQRGVSFFKKNPSKEISLPIKPLSPSECLGLKKGGEVFSSPCFGGFVFDNKSYVPGWLEKKGHKENLSFLGDAYVDFSTLERGDFLVHEDFGVGKYLGLAEEEGKEFLVLKYQDAQIKVFPSLFNRVSFFEKADKACSLDFVGKKGGWKRRVSLTKKRLSVFVDLLFQNYLKRNSYVSKKYYIDKDIEKDFLKGFPYLDTADQARSWAEIKKDLCSSSPMERLLCGDVGFGKTEIAIRASFLAAINGEKTAVVAPTTILSKQLFLSFSERLKKYGITVGFLSRFVSSSDAKKTIDLFINKKIDVLVGTHSIINNEDCLKEASLLIVDDEHKFGVKQKSFVKSIKTSINILYMSATPIPRTLNLALSEFSNISLISTPPPLKVATKTYVDPYDIKIIKRALSFEFSRGGQSFIIHNDIKTIKGVVSKIKQEVPFLNIDFMHAQEDPSVIEKKMDLFINKKIDVLVASTILENGINIKNVNTVIINNSHLFGVSQLYQIRGRVGRGGSSSFAYLMYPKNLSLSGVAKRRLNTIRKNSSLGSCYSVAMEDLKLRGGGALFGYKQSGSINSVGVELYGKLLKEASSKSPQPVRTIISHSLPSFIPKEYLPSPKLRVWAYKEISLLKTIESLDLFLIKITNMFGPPPAPFKRFLFIKRVEVLAGRCGFSKVFQKEDGVELFLNKDVWGGRVEVLTKSLEEVFFSFLNGGESVFLRKRLDNNFILILNKIYARLCCEK